MPHNGNITLNNNDLKRHVYKMGPFCFYGVLLTIVPKWNKVRLLLCWTGCLLANVHIGVINLGFEGNMEINEGKQGWWGKPWLSNREWIFVIVILGLIGYVSLLHHKSVSALGYVSFAGTIVSIIVGVLAIIYAMLESVRQSESGDKLQAGAASIKKAASSIGAKIEVMENVSLEIVRAKEELSKAAETTNKLIHDTLQQFSTQFDHLHQSHSNLDSQIAKIE